MFNQNLIKIKKNIAAAHSLAHDPLLKKITTIVLEYATDAILCAPRPRVLILGWLCPPEVEQFLRALEASLVIWGDISIEFLKKISNYHKVAFTLESWPFPKNSFDLIIAGMNFHTAENLPQAVKSIHSSLKAQGRFFGFFYGPRTLQELKYVIAKIEAQQNIAYHHFSPTLQLEAAASTAKNAGFSQVVSITDLVQIPYLNPQELVQHLRSLGETNSLNSKAPNFTLAQARKIYNNFNANFASYEIITVGGLATDKNH